jgi:peptidoglycan hydrolase-like protein with peptidoglycan-binding domain
VLKIGDSGDAVSQVQQQLNALGYWLGTIDGKFGGTTQQAVYAIQKAAGLSRSGKVDAATRTAINNGVRPTPKSTSGSLIEVDLTRDILMFVQNGKLAYTINTSTGGGYTYYDEGVRSVAITPKGHFQTYRVIQGVHVAPLGTLISPRFFTGGYAIHGDDSVPPYPATHGCVRVSNAAIAWIWSANLDTMGSTVWIY